MLSRAVRTIAEVRREVNSLHRLGKTIGFVPTMGALHDGHMDLVRASKKENDVTIASIFVNPTQFLPGEDFNKYPRMEEADLKLLSTQKTDLVYFPSTEEIYQPTAPGAFVEVPSLDGMLEGNIRPGHFRGVCTVVTKLLNVVTPTRLYLGQKDAQQVAVLRALVASLLIDTQVVVVPTARDSDGLAKSSRNAYLSAAHRKEAPIVYAALRKVVDAYELKGLVSKKDLVSDATALVTSNPACGLQYLSVAHPTTLKELDAVDPAVGALVSIAVKLGTTRLIDNVILPPKRLTDRRL